MVIGIQPPPAPTTLEHGPRHPHRGPAARRRRSPRRARRCPSAPYSAPGRRLHRMDEVGGVADERTGASATANQRATKKPAGGRAAHRPSRTRRQATPNPARARYGRPHPAMRRRGSASLVVLVHTIHQRVPLERENGDEPVGRSSLLLGAAAVIVFMASSWSYDGRLPAVPAVNGDAGVFTHQCPRARRRATRSGALYDDATGFQVRCYASRHPASPCLLWQCGTRSLLLPFAFASSAAIRKRSSIICAKGLPGSISLAKVRETPDLVLRRRAGCRRQPCRLLVLALRGHALRNTERLEQPACCGDDGPTRARHRRGCARASGPRRRREEARPSALGGSAMASARPAKPSPRALLVCLSACWRTIHET